MNPLLLWCGSHPVFFYLVALMALFSTVVLAVWSPRAESGRRLELVFLGGVFTTLFAWRWPIFLAPFPLNPDECTWAAGALKALVSFAPWHGFNPGTSGPLNVYIVVLPALFGAPISFASGRIIATCLLGTTMLALYYGVKWMHGARVARLALVPAIIFLSLTTDWDFVSYSSEHLSICLTTIALAASVYLAKEASPFSSRLAASAIAGFCIGSTLFAKPQAVPLAFLVFIFAAGALVPSWKHSRKEATRVGVTLLAAVCVVPVTIILSLCWTGELRDAYFSYIGMNLIYAGGGLQKVRLLFFLEYSPTYTAFMGGSVLVVLAGALAHLRRKNITRQVVIVWTASFLFLLTALFVIFKPHREFPHYLLFSIVPLSICVANALGLGRENDFRRNGEARLAVLFAALFLLPALSVTMASGNPFVRNLSYNVTHRRSAVAMAISKYAKRGDPICVWGWASEYYVQTGAYPATHELEVEYFIRPGPYNRFRPRYMSDIKRNKPVVFVDAVSMDAFYFTDRATQGHEIFPELAAYIQDNYVLKEEVSGVRIYVVKAR
jgi:hypothetical protein